MSTTLPLPPSARDFQIYQRLLLDGYSTRQAASDFSLSQTRIRQIVHHVAHWLAHSLPPSCETTDAAYLRLALHIAADRLQMIYGEAMHGWRATHESRYASVILRVTAAMGKMPVTAGALDALLADALEGPLPDDTTTLARSASEGKTPSTTETPRANEPTLDLGLGALDSNFTPYSSAQSAICNSQFAICNPPSAIPSPPPVGDCSLTTTSDSPMSEINASLQPLTPSPSTPSIIQPPDQCAARRAFLSPAHSLKNTGNDDEVTQLKLTPQTLGFTTQQHSSPRDRRRLRRLAAKS